MRHSPEYSVWSGLKRRCENKNETCYPRYGGAGISVEFTSFEEFFAEVGKRPSAKHSIERIDNDGNYAPGNVKWATATEQARNKGNTLFVEVRGVSKCLADWCEEYGQPYKMAWQRIRKQGWTPERALTEPSRWA